MTTFTSGPAMATSSSCIGLSGILSILAMPPMGDRMTSGVLMPKRLPIRICPNSCKVTQVNTRMMKTSESNAAAAPPAA